MSVSNASISAPQVRAVCFILNTTALDSEKNGTAIESSFLMNEINSSADVKKLKSISYFSAILLSSY